MQNGVVCLGNFVEKFRLRFLGSIKRKRSENYKLSGILCSKILQTTLYQQM